MKISTTLTTAIAATLLVMSSTSQAVSCWRGVCHVQKGDTLAKIAKANDVSVNTLMKNNNIKDPRKLYVGKTIYLAGPASAAPAVSAQPTDNNMGVGYDLPNAAGYASNLAIVTPGDTLFSISRASGISVDQLKQLNGLTSNTIYVGQRLMLH